MTTLILLALLFLAAKASYNFGYKNGKEIGQHAQRAADIMENWQLKASIHRKNGQFKSKKEISK